MTRQTFFILSVFMSLFFACRKEHVSNDICDCAESHSTYVIDTITLTIPNLFTPQGDGCNDGWIIKNIDKFPDCKIKVTRPGLLGGTVYESSGYHQYWNGENNNKILKEGKYKYEITIKGQTYSGFVCIYYAEPVPKNHDCINACVTTGQNDPIAN